MNFRLRMSVKATNTLKELQTSTRLTPNVLARLAISLSLIQNELPTEIEDESPGMEINRHTLTGKHDVIFRCLIAQRHGRTVNDEEYFPGLIKQHIERGVELLLNEYKYAGSYERLIQSLITLGDNHDIPR